MTEILNAFHPDFMKTYYPDFTKDFRTVEANQKARLANPVKKAKRIRKPKVNYKVPKKPITMGEVHNELAELKKKILAPREFYTYAKAGMPKPFGFDKGKKKHGTNT
jgi:hypothetical protein